MNRYEVHPAVRRFESHRQVIAGILEARRRNRVHEERALELYPAFDPRPPLDHEPYHRLIAGIS